MEKKTATRNTRQKEAIRKAFVAANRPLSAEETLALAQDGVSIATVYRNIGVLLEERWLTAVEVPGGVTRYEVAGKAHHHHFQCDRCGRVFELEGCGLVGLPVLPEGFQSTGHELFLYGLCAGCG